MRLQMLHRLPAIASSLGAPRAPSANTAFMSIRRTFSAIHGGNTKEMYAVVKYFNYRKDVSWNLLAIFPTEGEALTFAKKSCEIYSAEKSLDCEDAEGWPLEQPLPVVDNVANAHVGASGNLVAQFTIGSGYGCRVFACMRVPVSPAVPQDDPRKEAAWEQRRKDNAEERTRIAKSEAEDVAKTAVGGKA